MLSKRGKTALFQISILLISIFAFAILSSENVDSANKISEEFCKGDPTNFLCDPPQKEKVGSEVASQKDLPPPSATLPVTISSFLFEFKSTSFTKAKADGIWAGYGTGFLGNIAQGL